MEKDLSHWTNIWEKALEKNLFKEMVPGRQATPINDPHMQQVAKSAMASQPQQVKLSDLASQVSDIKWHQLYDVFARQFRMNPKDQNVTAMGQALHQAATTGNMAAIQPFLSQVNAQRI